MSKQESHLYEFGPYRLLPQERLLLRDGEPVALTPKAFETLVALVRRAGRLADKDELLKEVWPDSFVEESNLAQNVFALRRALGEGEQGKPYIETVPKRGYRFLASVKVVEDQADELFVEQHVSARTRAHEAEVGEQASQPGFLSREAADEGHAREDVPVAPVQLPGIAKRQSARLALLILGLVAVLTIASVLFFRMRGGVERDSSVSSSQRRIAVLPFRPMGPDGSDEYLQLGMADALITKLSNIKQLVVRPTSSVRTYTDPDQDPVAAGRALQVESVLTGEVQKVGERVRVTVQLISVKDGSSVWAEKFDEPFTDIFGVQDAISERVAEALRIQLAGSERELLAKRPTDNIEAYQFYLRGNYHLYNLTPDEMGKALRFFNEAIARDPAYALAYAGLANAYGIASSFGDDTAALRAEAAATKAIEFDPTLAEAHAALAATRFWQKRDARGAQDSFSHALELTPNSAIVHHQYAWFLIATARFDEGEKNMRRALELDPLSPAINVDQGLPLFFARRYEEARARYERALELDAESFYAHLRLGEAYEGVGDFARAVGEFERAVALSNNAPTLRAQLARALALAGRKEEARRLLDEITSKDSQPAPSPYHLALAYAGLDETSEAFAWLDQALAKNDKWLGWINVDPRLDALRRDARFHDLLRRASLERGGG